MPPKKRVAATKLRWAKWREEPAEEEPDDEPEVELEEPVEEPAAVEPHTLSPVRFKKYSEEWWLLKKALNLWASWKDKKEQDEWEAVEKAKEVAYAKEMEEIDAKCAEDIRMMELDWPAWEQQQAAACANGCVCVCRYGGSRKRDLSAMGSPLVSRNVSTFIAKV